MLNNQNNLQERGNTGDQTGTSLSFLQKEQRFSSRGLLRSLKLHNKNISIFLQVLGI